VRQCSRRLKVAVAVAAAAKLNYQDRSKYARDAKSWRRDVVARSLVEDV